MDDEEDLNAEFQQGDIVRLISGGPPMCVRSSRSDGGVHVTWFFRGKTGEAVYRTKMLMRCDSDEAIALGFPLKSGPKPARHTKT